MSDLTHFGSGRMYTGVAGGAETARADVAVGHPSLSPPTRAQVAQ